MITVADERIESQERATHIDVNESSAFVDQFTACSALLTNNSNRTIVRSSLLLHTINGVAGFAA